MRVVLVATYGYDVNPDHYQLNPGETLAEAVLRIDGEAVDPIMSDAVMNGEAAISILVKEDS
jgi:hypothetical protein